MTFQSIGDLKIGLLIFQFRQQALLAKVPNLVQASVRIWKTQNYLCINFTILCCCRNGWFHKKSSFDALRVIVVCLNPCWCLRFYSLIPQRHTRSSVGHSSCSSRCLQLVLCFLVGLCAACFQVQAPHNPFSSSARLCWGSAHSSRQLRILQEFRSNSLSASVLSVLRS